MEWFVSEVGGCNKVVSNVLGFVSFLHVFVRILNSAPDTFQVQGNGRQGELAKVRSVTIGIELLGCLRIKKILRKFMGEEREVAERHVSFVLDFVLTASSLLKSEQAAFCNL